MLVRLEASDGRLDDRDVGILLLQHAGRTLLHVKLLQGLRHLRGRRLADGHSESVGASFGQFNIREHDPLTMRTVQVSNMTND